MYNVFIDGNDAHPELKELFLVTKLLVTLSTLDIKSARFYIDDIDSSYKDIKIDEMSHFLSIAFMNGETYD